jgi:hypothetical protein
VIVSRTADEIGKKFLPLPVIEVLKRVHTPSLTHKRGKSYTALGFDGGMAGYECYFFKKSRRRSKAFYGTDSIIFGVSINSGITL